MPLLVHHPTTHHPNSSSAPPSRSQVDPKYQWNLDDLYISWDDWEKDLATLGAHVDTLAGFQGRLGDGPDPLKGFLTTADDAGRLFDRVWYYPALSFDLDQRDNTINARRQQVEDLSARFAAAVSWFDPELIAVGRDTVMRWLDQDDDLALYRFHLEEIFRQADHVLDAGGERILALSSRFGGTPSQAYSMLTTADAIFPSVELSDGRHVKVSPGAYSSLLRSLPDQRDRATVFHAHYTLFRENANTYAALYNGVLQRGWFHARARNYPSVLERKLYPHAIPAEVVHTLVETARGGMEPMRRYHRLRKQKMGLDQYHLYDSFAPLVRSDRSYPFDEAVDTITRSLAPLGEDYQQRVADAFQQRWVDAYETEGKRSGGYMAGVHGVHPFILMNYHNTLDDVFTLAHEMGHAMHSVLSDETQPFVYAQYTIFVAEVASTLNEALLLDEMLRTADSPRERATLLQHAIDSIAGTFFTQSMFADFELNAHARVEAGEPITRDVLSGIYEGLLERWYGDAVDRDELYRFTWARIPHFFHSPYYVYQYATSFAASSAIFQAMQNAEDDRARTSVVNRYLDLLRSGGSDHPMELLKQAGVDLSQPDPVRAVVARVDGLVDRLEQELANLDG